MSFCSMSLSEVDATSWEIRIVLSYYNNFFFIEIETTSETKIEIAILRAKTFWLFNSRVQIR